VSRVQGPRFKIQDSWSRVWEQGSICLFIVLFTPGPGLCAGKMCMLVATVT
jgi:hypothetical protein